MGGAFIGTVPTQEPEPRPAPSENGCYVIYALESSPKYEERAVLVQVECEQVCLAGAEGLRDLGRGAVPSPDPHDLRWMSEQKASLMEIGALGDDGVPVLSG